MYRNKRRMLAAAAVLLASVFLLIENSGKSKETATENKTMIAVSTIGPTHAWAENVKYYAEEELKKVCGEEGWDYVCLAADDTNEQSSQVEQLIRDGADCIIMLPMDGASLKTAALSVKNAGIPLVIFDREIPEFAPTATVKGDNTGIGVETARYFNSYFPDGTVVLELMGDTSTVPFLRTDGFDNTINSNFTKIQIGYTEWQREKAKTLFHQWIQEQDVQTLASVGAIFTHDDEIALGVLDELDEYREAGTLEKMFPNLQVIAGSSASQEMYRRIETEEYFTLFSMTYVPQMIQQAVDVGAAIIKEEDYEEMTIISTTRVDKSNVQNYLENALSY